MNTEEYDSAYLKPPLVPTRNKLRYLATPHSHYRIRFGNVANIWQVDDAMMKIFQVSTKGQYVIAG